MTTRSAPVLDPSLTRPARARSVITNGGLPGGVRQTSAQGRRYRDIRDLLLAEIGSDLTPSQRLQLDNIVGLQMQAEAMRGQILQGQAVDSEQLVRVSNSADRMLRMLKRATAPQRAPRSPFGRQPHPLAREAAE